MKDITAPTSKSPVSSKPYNGNASDSDHEDVVDRHKMEDKIFSRGSHLSNNERKIVNHIVEKRLPVFSFIEFFIKISLRRNIIFLLMDIYFLLSLKVRILIFKKVILIWAKRN